MKPLPLGADNFSTDSQSILSQPSRRKHNQRKAVKVVSPKTKPSSRRNHKSEKRLVTQSNRPGSQEEIILKPERGERRQPMFLGTCAREDAQKRSDEQLLLKLSLLAPAKPEASGQVTEPHFDHRRCAGSTLTPDHRSRDSTEHKSSSNQSVTSEKEGVFVMGAASNLGEKQYRLRRKQYPQRVPQQSQLSPPAKIDLKRPEPGRVAKNAQARTLPQTALGGKPSGQAEVVLSTRHDFTAVASHPEQRESALLQACEQPGRDGGRRAQHLKPSIDTESLMSANSKQNGVDDSQHRAEQDPEYFKLRAVFSHKAD